MQTTRRERLMRMTFDESAYGFAAMAKCVVCIGLLALLTVIGFGASADDAATPGALSAGRGNTAAHVAVRAEAHRKQVFDERRAQFERTDTHLSTAATAVETHP